MFKKLAILAILPLATLAHAGLSNPGNTQIPGVGTNYTAPAGFLGQQITSTVLAGSAVSLTTATAANVTSISLTPGDWIVWGNICTSPGATTTVSVFQGSISTTSATFPTAPNGGAWVLAPYSLSSAGTPECLPVGMLTVSISTTTTYYLIAQATFAVSTNAVYGSITAMRIP